MYYIAVDGKTELKEDLWEEALVTAAQLDYMYNAPEVNDGVVGTHKIEILDKCSRA